MSIASQLVGAIAESPPSSPERVDTLLRITVLAETAENFDGIGVFTMGDGSVVAVSAGAVCDFASRQDLLTTIESRINWVANIRS